METAQEETETMQMMKSVDGISKFERWFDRFKYKEQLIQLGFDNAYDLLLLSARSLDRIYQDIPPKYAAEVEREAHLDKNIASWGNSKEAMVVNIALWIENFSDINEANQTVGVDFYVRYNWHQKHLATLPYNDGDSLPEAMIEKHMIYIDNDADLQVVGAPKLILEDKSTGLVRQTIRYKGSIKIKMDYHLFPFDTQDISIIFQSIKGNMKYESGDWYRTDATKNGSGLFKSAAFVYNMGQSDENKETYQYIFALSATRKSNAYYFWNIMVLLYIITNFGLLSYGIASDDFSSRLSNDITLLLTITAFQYTFKSSLPRVNYLTLFDYYILLCFVFIIVIACEHFFISLAAFSDEGKQRFESIFYVISFIAWSVFHLCICIFHFFCNP